MHLTRIQVPEFRALKNVDITFEKDFTPKVFPLGSENGGGKSTLLQLIFVLLHCAIHPDKTSFVENLLARYRLPEDVNQQTLAKMDIWDGEKTVQIEFLCCDDDFLKTISEEHNPSFSSLQEKEGTDRYYWYLIDNSILECLHNEGYLYITNYSKESYWEEDSFSKTEALLCRFSNFPLDNGKVFLRQLSEKVFLVAPSTQVYLFLQEKEKKLVLQAYQKKQASYELALRRIKTKLPNFFTYDFFSTDILVKYFQDARNLDFEQAVNTGEYGNRYQQILNEINQVLMPGKKILPQIQSSHAKTSEEDPIEGIIFKTENDETLYPEDLSHGELKRLSLYVWIQYHRMKDAIVLMDEIENGFHPDWQYRIISDLAEWGANNQYILATHSYELCQAVTPAHVKELEPKLLPSE